MQLETNRQSSHLEWLLPSGFKEGIRETALRRIALEDLSFTVVINVDLDFD